MIRTLLAIGLLQVLTMVVQLVRTKALALVLGPEQVGLMAVVDKLVAVLVQTASLSLPFAAVRFLPAIWSADPPAFGDLARRMRNVMLVTTVMVGAGALVVTGLWPEAWGRQLANRSSLVALALAGLPALALAPFWQNAMAGRLAQNRAMVIALGHAIVLALATAGVIWAGLQGYYAVYAVLGSLFVILVGRRVLGGSSGTAGGQRPRRFSLALPRQVWRFSAALMTLTFATPYAALFIHYRVLSDHGAEAAGWMQAAMGIAFAVRGVIGAAHGVFLTPNVNRDASPEGRMAWANRFQVAFGLLGVVLLPPVLLFPDLVVRVLYSGAFQPGAAFVWLFVLVELTSLLAGTYQTIVIALDELRFHVVQNLAAQALIVAGGWVLIQRMGLLGAGIAALAGPVLLAAGTTGFLRWRHDLRVAGRALFVAGLLVGMVILTGLLGVLRPDYTGTTIATKLAAYGLVLGIVAITLRSAEWDALRSVIRRKPPGSPST